MKSDHWPELFRLAMTQDGLVSTQQASVFGCSPQQLGKFLASGKLERVQRSIYRVVGVPPGQHDDFMAVWLWSRTEGVLSHETALFLYELSNVLPAAVNITVPRSWERRTIRIPAGTIVHYDDVSQPDRGWMGSLPVTTVRRTLTDCLHGTVAPELVEQASMQAASRGLISSKETITAPVVQLWRAKSA